MISPFSINLVVLMLDLEGHDRGGLPGLIKSECFLGADCANQEVVEQMPLALAR